MKKLFKGLLIAVGLFVGSAFLAALYQNITGEKIALEEPSAKQAYHILSVSDFDYTMGGKQAVSISIGRTKEDYFSITVHRDQIKNKTRILRNTATQPKIIDAETTINHLPYFFLRRDGMQSVIEFNIHSIDYKTKQAHITVYMKLYNGETGKDAEFKKQVFIVRDNMFSNLIKTI